jgi:hypothetical protein
VDCVIFLFVCLFLFFCFFVFLLHRYAKSTVESTGISARTEMDPAKMTPPQRRRMAARIAQLESPSVRAIMEEVKNETESIRRATSLVRCRAASTEPFDSV